MRDWALRVDEVPAPVPGPGQVLCRVLAAGLCAADQDLLEHGADAEALSISTVTTSPDPPLGVEGRPAPRGPLPFDPTRDVVLGQEVCAEVVDTGPDVSNLAPGDVVVSAPVVFDRHGTHVLGRSNTSPGGYGEYVVFNELIALKVPNGTPPAHATFTDPVATGLHAIRSAQIDDDRAAIVVGLGQTGLGCIAALRTTTTGPIIGVDSSASRRSMAERLGATTTIDPTTHDLDDAITRWRSVADDRPPVVFDTSGRPDGLDHAMRIASRGAHIVVVGGCLQPSAIHSSIGASRQLTIAFVVGYDPDEFGAALRAIASCAVDVGELVTATITLDEVPPRSPTSRAATITPRSSSRPRRGPRRSAGF